MTTRGKVAVTILTVLGVLLLAWFLREAVRIVNTDQTISVRTVPPSPPDSESSEAFRAYRNPIHAGGVKDVASLRRLLQQDPAIAGHFRDAGFDVNCAADEILAANIWARVSYRTGSGFGYTVGPVLVLAGEHVIVDNCHGVIVRGRCANIILQPEKRPELSTEGPQAGILATPEGSPADPAPSDAPFPPDVPPAPPGTPSTPPQPPGTPFYPPTCCFVGFAPPPGSPTAVPEPSTWSLLIAGSAVLLGFWILRGSR